jgi:3-phosphoglycerate kinase
MRSVRDIRVFENIPVLVRASLNVPIENGAVMNDYRLRRALPTIRFLAARGARVILISHLGEAGTETLAPVADALRKLIPNVAFCGETIGEAARAAVRTLLPGHVLVLENLRRHKGETGNDREFAQEVAALADAFVQDSFDTCHRRHASIVTMPTLLPSFAGLVLEEEITALSEALAPKHPALAVVGGAKFSTKEAVLEALMKNYDHVFVGGALANDFLKASGKEVGVSLVSSPDPKMAEMAKDPKFVLPVDARVLPKELLGAPDAREKSRVASVDEVRPDEMILDVGPGTTALLADLAGGAKAVLWNGPLGLYEKGFADATYGFAQAVAASRAHSVVGGGDTIATIDRLDLMPRFSFVSTGGGAMLDFLAKGSLPGIDALDRTYGSD